MMAFHVLCASLPFYLFILLVTVTVLTKDNGLLLSRDSVYLDVSLLASF